MDEPAPTESEQPPRKRWPLLLAAVSVVAAVAVVAVTRRDDDADKPTAANARIERCRTTVLDEHEKLPQAEKEAAAKLHGGDIEANAIHACSLAESHGVLAPNGDVLPTDEYVKAACLDTVLTNFLAIPEQNRIFSNTDLAKIGHRFCDAAIRRNLAAGAGFEGTSPAIKALGKEVVNEMVESGAVRELMPRR